MKPSHYRLFDEAEKQGYGSLDELAATNLAGFDQLAQERIEAAQSDVAEKAPGTGPEDRGEAQGGEEDVKGKPAR